MTIKALIYLILRRPEWLYYRLSPKDQWAAINWIADHEPGYREVMLGGGGGHVHDS